MTDSAFEIVLQNHVCKIRRQANKKGLLRSSLTLEMLLGPQTATSTQGLLVALHIMFAIVPSGRGLQRSV